jgi:hypothetical protein
MGVTSYSSKFGFATGTYTGNDTADRAIPHGLGRQCKFVFISKVGAAITQCCIFDNYAGTLSTGSSPFAVTAPTATNFYVGNIGSYPASFNGTGIQYNWVAF